MTAVELLQRAHDLGLQLEPQDGDRLAVRPASKLPPDLADALRYHKTELLGLLATSAVIFPNGGSPEGPLRKGWQSVPPPDLPMVPLKPRPTPTRHKLVIDYMLRQCGDQHLREWLTRRKAAYFETTFKTWDSGLLTYAAARDAACWQLNRPEAEVWPLLEGIESCVKDLKSKQMT
jgi:hypothetical protein